MNALYFVKENRWIIAKMSLKKDLCYGYKKTYIYLRLKIIILRSKNKIRLILKILSEKEQAMVDYIVIESF